MSRAGLNHLTHELVSKDVAAPHRRHQAIHQTMVWTADRAACHLDDDISTILDFRVGHAIATEYRSRRANKRLPSVKPVLS
jgi:hypothetical protein